MPSKLSGLSYRISDIALTKFYEPARRVAVYINGKPSASYAYLSDFIHIGGKWQAVVAVKISSRGSRKSMFG